MRNNDVINGSLPGGAETIPLTGMIDSLLENLHQILWRRLRIVLLPAVLALLIGWVYLLRATPLYPSTSRIYVEQMGPPILERNASGTITRWDSYLYAQAELLQSTEILSAALKSPALADLPSFAQAQSSIGALRRGLEVEVGKRDDIINVSFTTAYPEEAAGVVRAVVDAYIDAQNKHKTSLSAGAVRILVNSGQAERLTDKRQKLVDFGVAERGHGIWNQPTAMSSCTPWNNFD
jgi:uncharacterized protein involved in exopolysaccharide biosynthesis